MFKNKNFCVNIFDTSFYFCFDSPLILVFFDFNYLHSRYAKFIFLKIVLLELWIFSLTPINITNKDTF